MKDPKDFESINEIPDVFGEALSHRIGDLDRIKAMSREEIVREQVVWKLGDAQWYDTFKWWLHKAGLEIVESENQAQ